MTDTATRSAIFKATSLMMSNCTSAWPEYHQTLRNLEREMITRDQEYATFGVSFEQLIARSVRKITWKTRVWLFKEELFGHASSFIRCEDVGTPVNPIFVYVEGYVHDNGHVYITAIRRDR